jgi:hypothetical protein
MAEPNAAARGIRRPPVGNLPPPRPREEAGGVAGKKGRTVPLMITLALLGRGGWAFTMPGLGSFLRLPPPAAPVQEPPKPAPKKQEHAPAVAVPAESRPDVSEPARAAPGNRGWITTSSTAGVPQKESAVGILGGDSGESQPPGGTAALDELLERLASRLAH